jgi:hypothetical protein
MIGATGAGRRRPSIRGAKDVRLLRSLKDQSMLSRAIVACVLAVTLVLSFGCADTVKEPILARQDPYQREQIHIASMDLRRHTAVEAPIMTRDDAGILFVTVPIRAATNLELYVDYRVTFFDRNGQTLHQTSWLHKTLAPNVPDQIMFNSTTNRATDFQMDLRYSK